LPKPPVLPKKKTTDPKKSPTEREKAKFPNKKQPRGARERQPPKRTGKGAVGGDPPKVFPKQPDEKTGRICQIGFVRVNFGGGEYFGRVLPILKTKKQNYDVRELCQKKKKRRKKKKDKKRKPESSGLTFTSP